MTVRTVTEVLFVVSIVLGIVAAVAWRWGAQVLDREDARRPRFIRVGHRFLFLAVVVGLVAFALDPDPRG